MIACAYGAESEAIAWPQMGSPGPRGKCLQWDDAVVPHRGLAPNMLLHAENLTLLAYVHPTLHKSLTFIVSSALLGALSLAAGAR